MTFHSRSPTKVFIVVVHHYVQIKYCDTGSDNIKVKLQKIKFTWSKYNCTNFIDYFLIHFLAITTVKVTRVD